MGSQDAEEGEGKSLLTDSTTENLSKNFGLFHFCTVDLTPNHRAERNLGSEFLRNSEGKSGFASARCAGEQECTSRELAGFDEFDYDTTGLEEFEFKRLSKRRS